MLNPSDGLPDDRKSLYPQSQSSAYKCGDKTSPISVILVSSGSRGNKLLFRYPYQKVAECPSSLSGRGSISMKQKHKHLRTHRCRFHVITYLQEIIKQQCNPGQTNSPFCCDCRLWNCGLSFFFFFLRIGSACSSFLKFPSWPLRLLLVDVPHKFDVLLFIHKFLLLLVLHQKVIAVVSVCLLCLITFLIIGNRLQSKRFPNRILYKIKHLLDLPVSVCLSVIAPTVLDQDWPRFLLKMHFNDTFYLVNSEIYKSSTL